MNDNYDWFKYLKTVFVVACLYALLVYILVDYCGL